MGEGNREMRRPLPHFPSKEPNLLPTPDHWAASMRTEWRVPRDQGGWGVRVCWGGRSPLLAGLGHCPVTN